MLYLGLHVVQMLHGRVAESLLGLLARGLGAELFATAGAPDTGEQLILLHKTFDLQEKLALRVTGQLEREYCCVFHFLAGRRRVMEKANAINVS